MGFRSSPANWKDPRHRLGADGEEIAERFLTGRGWRVLARRFRMGRLEVDLIVRKDAIVAFVEVKTRLTRRYGTPAQAVTWHKQREIGRVAQAWIDRYGCAKDTTYRFDVIGITRLPDQPCRIEHLADAFRLVRP